MRYFTAALICSVLAQPVVADIITPSDVSATSQFGLGVVVVDSLIDGSGLDGNGAVEGQLHDNVDDHMWFSGCQDAGIPGGTPPDECADPFGVAPANEQIVEFELDTTYDLSSAVIWQYNEFNPDFGPVPGRGVKSFEMLVSPNLTDPFTSLGNFELAIADPGAEADAFTEPAQTLELGDLPETEIVRRVRFNVLDVHDAAQAYVGLSEVRFDGTQVQPPLPVPTLEVEVFEEAAGDAFVPVTRPSWTVDGGSLLVESFDGDGSIKPAGESAGTGNILNPDRMNGVANEGWTISVSSPESGQIDANEGHIFFFVHSIPENDFEHFNRLTRTVGAGDVTVNAQGFQTQTQPQRFGVRVADDEANSFEAFVEVYREGAGFGQAENIFLTARGLKGGEAFTTLHVDMLPTLNGTAGVGLFDNLTFSIDLAFDSTTRQWTLSARITDENTASTFTQSQVVSCSVSPASSERTVTLFQETASNVNTACKFTEVNIGQGPPDIERYELVRAAEGSSVVETFTGDGSVRPTGDAGTGNMLDPARPNGVVNEGWTLSVSSPETGKIDANDGHIFFFAHGPDDPGFEGEVFNRLTRTVGPGDLTLNAQGFETQTQPQRFGVRAVDDASNSFEAFVEVFREGAGFGQAEEIRLIARGLSDEGSSLTETFTGDGSIRPSGDAGAGNMLDPARPNGVVNEGWAISVSSPETGKIDANDGHIFFFAHGPDDPAFEGEVYNRLTRTVGAGDLTVNAQGFETQTQPQRFGVRVIDDASNQFEASIEVFREGAGFGQAENIFLTASGVSGGEPFTVIKEDMLPTLNGAGDPGVGLFDNLTYSIDVDFDSDTNTWGMSAVVTDENTGETFTQPQVVSCPVGPASGGRTVTIFQETANNVFTACKFDEVNIRGDSYTVLDVDMLPTLNGAGDPGVGLFDNLTFSIDLGFDSTARTWSVGAVVTDENTAQTFTQEEVVSHPVSPASLKRSITVFQETANNVFTACKFNEVSVTTAGGEEVIVLGRNQTEYTDRDVAFGAPICYTVRAVNGLESDVVTERFDGDGTVKPSGESAGTGNILNPDRMNGVANEGWSIDVSSPESGQIDANEGHIFFFVHSIPSDEFEHYNHLTRTVGAGDLILNTQGFQTQTQPQRFGVRVTDDDSNSFEAFVEVFREGAGFGQAENIFLTARGVTGGQSFEVLNVDMLPVLGGADGIGLFDNLTHCIDLAYDSQSSTWTVSASVTDENTASTFTQAAVVSGPVGPASADRTVTIFQETASNVNTACKFTEVNTMTVVETAGTLKGESEQVCVTPAPIPRPGPASNLQAELVDVDGAVLTWEAPAGGEPVSAYTILRDGDVIGAVDAATLTFSDPAPLANPGVTLCYRIRAEGDQTGLLSNEACVQADYGAPVVNAAAGDGVVTLTITFPDDVLSGTVRVFRQGGELIAEVPIDRSEIIIEDDSVEADTEYCYEAERSYSSDLACGDIVSPRSEAVCVTIGPAGPAQLAGDCNQDGEVGIADVMCSVNLLFPGFDLLHRDPQEAPCSDDAGNVTVLDVNGDGVVNGSDIVSLSSYLFSGGPPPAQGTECFAAVESCGANVGCE